MELINQAFFSSLLPPHQFDLSPITKHMREKVRTRVIASCINLVPFLPMEKKRPTKGGKQNNCFKEERKKEEPNHNRANYTRRRKNCLCVSSARFEGGGDDS
jgi:hypothetical protein